jgi:hypothetical protein
VRRDFARGRSGGGGIERRIAQLMRMFVVRRKGVLWLLVASCRRIPVLPASGRLRLPPPIRSRADFAGLLARTGGRRLLCTRSCRCATGEKIWIPAFAGMTESLRVFIPVPGRVFMSDVCPRAAKKRKRWAQPTLGRKGDILNYRLLARGLDDYSARPTALPILWASSCFPSWPPCPSWFRNSYRSPHGRRSGPSYLPPVIDCSLRVVRVFRGFMFPCGRGGRGDIIGSSEGRDGLAGGAGRGGQDFAGKGGAGGVEEEAWCDAVTCGAGGGWPSRRRPRFLDHAVER